MKHTTESGFTLLELVAVIVIAAVMVTMAVPSLVTFVKSNRMTTQINDFVASTNIARIEATKRGQRVVLCKSSDGNTCSTTTTGWEQGWIAFVDANSDGIHDAAEDIVSSHEALTSGTTLTGSSDAGYGDLSNTFYFNADGTSSLTTYGEMVLCDPSNNASAARAIAINPVGRVQTINAIEIGATHKCV